MILIHCARGIVAFRSLGVTPRVNQQLYCMNSNKIFVVRYGPSNRWLADMQAVIAEAVRINGAMSSVNDVAELV